MEKNTQSPTLCKVFIAKTKEVLSHHPEVKHSWSIDQDETNCILNISKLDDDGFDITVEAFSNEIIVSADGPHHHFDVVKGIEAAVEDVLGLVRDLLSPSMRVIELCSNGKPYRWHLEFFRDGK